MSMASGNLRVQTQVSSSRAIAIIGLFSALYIVAAGISSYVTLYGYPEHFIRGILMTAVVLRTGKKWSATMMGVVSGIIFQLVVTSPAPYLLASTIVSGLVFDLVLMAGSSYTAAVRSSPRVITGAAISGLAESIVALAILTFAGFFSRSFVALSVAWSTDIVLNIALSAVGALIAIRFLSKKHPAGISQQSAAGGGAPP
ncbi:MAG: hypothetical protein ACREBS_08615 [Nitrososphaerales archaeon]